MRKIRDVSPAVDFNRESYLHTIEIENVTRHRVLAAKLQLTETAIAQPTPDRSLFARWAFPMFPRVLSELHAPRLPRSTTGSPSSGLRPPSPRGRGEKALMGLRYFEEEALV
ncbi:MAG TPA: hypothetical protein VF505_11170, partial [Thermoanaerobaculia bacterium]